MTISDELRERIRQQAGNRCGYCRSPQKYILGILEIDHIYPATLGGSDAEENLWLACRLCNSFKGKQTHGYDPLTERYVKLFNPRLQKWSRHFAWSEEGTLIMGKTACGRATIGALQLNNSLAVDVRTEWVKVGWHPPKDL